MPIMSLTVEGILGIPKAEIKVNVQDFVRTKMKMENSTMKANRMQKMPSLKTLSAHARSAAKPVARAASRSKPEKDKGVVKSFDQLKDLVRS